MNTETRSSIAKAEDAEMAGDFAEAARQYNIAGDEAGGHSEAARRYLKAKLCAARAKEEQQQGEESLTSISVAETVNLRLLVTKAQSLRFWANEAAETVNAQTCHDPELAPSWLPELMAVIADFDKVNEQT